LYFWFVEYKKRQIENLFAGLSSSFPAIWLTGPRQSGKTTLARSVYADFTYVSFEDLDMRHFGRSDPRGFLRQFPGKVILDEAQKCPELIPYLQTHMDEKGTNGQYILTGSHQFELARTIGQSLAGRAAVVTLLPFSLSELFATPGYPLDAAGSSPVGVPTVGDPLETVLYRGMYPAVHDRGADPAVWFASYHATYIERDVRDISGVSDVALFDTFVRLCAARSGCLVNYSDLGTATGVSLPTAKSWLSILELSGIVKLVRPYHNNLSKRLVKSPKLYFLDCGYLSYLLRITDPAQLAFHPLKGQLFETFMVSEIIKSFYHRLREPPLYFWRDNGDHEIDVLLDLGSGPVPVEIKLSETISPSMAKTIRWWQALREQHPATGTVIYGGKDTQTMNNILYRSWQVPL
jgi:hypothetical protein